jgi:hypothetical protein
MSNNNQAICATLEIKNLYSESKNTLHDLFMLQKDIQENVYGYDFKKMQEGPLSDMRKFFDWNYHAIQDEMRETMEALGGVRDGIGSGIWKPWKSTHKQAETMTFVGMSESDKKELKMELIDHLHFLFNKMHAVGMTPEELFNYYFAKNEENRNRQKNGY